MYMGLYIYMGLYVYIGESDEVSLLGVPPFAPELSVQKDVGSHTCLKTLGLCRVYTGHIRGAPFR